MSRTLAIRPILERMVERRAICAYSIRKVIETFGENPKVTKANLRKAAATSFGLMHYRNFCAEWLDWPDELRMFLRDMEGDILWGSSPHSHKTFRRRRKIVQDAHVAATLAWIKEYNKP